MDVEQIELLPCPFCGAAGDSLIVEHLEGTILHPAHQVRCDNCGGSSGYTDHDCREAWNTRTALTPPEGYVPVAEVYWDSDEAEMSLNWMVERRPTIGTILYAARTEVKND
ncbi:TPA: Lar family restriction alleviation protein [Stenotrophomonas maltophilia]|nr:Lar family restriction alleviation protein [Stenotrophomonas maltophilia]